MQRRTRKSAGVRNIPAIPHNRVRRRLQHRCCCAAPGPVLTGAAMANMPTAIGRAAEPSGIVRLVMYPASDKAAFITGTTHLADGGRVCR